MFTFPASQSLGFGSHRWNASGPFLQVSVECVTHDEAGGVFGAVLRADALLARAILRFFAPFLARAFTPLARLRCPAALC